MYDSFTKRRKLWSLIAILLLVPLLSVGLPWGLAAPQPAEAGTCPHDPEGGGPGVVTLDECVTTTHFIVYYTTDTDDSPHHINSEAQAQRVADNLEATWDRYVNDPDFDLRVPKNTDVEELEVWIYDIGYLGVTSSSWNYMKIDSGYVRNDDLLQTKATPLHELFHRVQYKYDKSDEDSWAVEGQAKFMEDQVFTDLDDASGTQYQLRSNSYLGSPNWDVTTASYNASLFWKYFTEQYGSATDEPELGVDAIRHYWEAGESPGVANTSSVDNALDALGYPAVTFDDVYRDWIVANYTKDLATVPDDKYAYVDDDGNPYSSVDKALNTSIGAGDYMTMTSEMIDRWGAQYYRVTPEPSCTSINFNFDLNSGSPAYNVLAIKSDELVGHWSSTSSDWSKTIFNDGYDEVVAVVGGNGSDVDVDIGYGCVDLSLNIVVPTTVDPAFVGSILDPEKFLVRLEVNSPQNIKVESLNAQDFGIMVGTKTADVILGAYVQSQFWLLVQAPTQDTAGDYDLSASFAAASDTEFTAIKYITVVHDDMLVIDRSASMTTNDKIGAAKNAATLYVDATADGNMLGLVSFNGDLNEPNDDAYLEEDLASVNSTVRSDLKTAIDGLVAEGWTSIGDGLYLALDRLETLGDADHPCTMVLLSDGMENEARYWDHPTEPSVKADVVGSDCVVDTIALGPQTDEVLLQEIANLSGGTYYYVPDDNALARGVDQVGADWRNELASTYEYIQGDVAGRTRVFEAVGEVASGKPMTYTMPIPDDITEAVFFVDFAPTGAQNWIDLYDPTGYEITCEEAGVRCEYDYPHILIHVVNPALVAGTWTLVINSYQGPNAEIQQGTPFIAGASGNSHRTLHVFLGTPLMDRLQGMQFPILAALSDSGPILGGMVGARIIGPTGMVYQLRLFDDGNHGDGAANDGLYGNTFTPTSDLNPGDQTQGSYRVHVQSLGLPGTIGPRYGQLAFTVEKGADTDGDLMPDVWEDLHGLNKLDPSDASEDPDLEALDNLGEYNAGTDPHNSDTDGGGENDYSEVNLFGQDPLDPADDQIVAIGWANATANVASNVLTFDVAPEYNRLRLARATATGLRAPDLDYVWVENNVAPTGTYTDTGLTNGTSYAYKLMAVDGDGHRSAVADAQMAMPQADPFPPSHGALLINDGAPQTASRNVTLSFLFEEPGIEEDVAEVLVSNPPDFAGASWQPYAPTMPWTLAAGLQMGDVASVYVKFRDAAMNESPDVAGDSIEYVGTTFNVYLPLVTRND